LMDRDITPEQFAEWRGKAVKTLLESQAGRGVEEEDVLAEIETLMSMANEEGWLQMEWLENVVPLEDGETMEGVEMADGTGAHEKHDTLLATGSEYIGLGTMMQDATDYLSEARKADYERWKTKMIARIEEIEAA
jgi:origin recognition complex subunit 6